MAWHGLSSKPLPLSNGELQLQKGHQADQVLGAEEHQKLEVDGLGFPPGLGNAQGCAFFLLATSLIGIPCQWLSFTLLCDNLDVRQTFSWSVNGILVGSTLFPKTGEGMKL